MSAYSRGLFYRRIVKAALSLALFIPADASAIQEGSARTDSLPAVFSDDTDVLHGLYRHRALNSSKKHQLPGGIEEWSPYREQLKAAIIKNAGVKFFKDLPLDIKETKSFAGNGFTIKNIYFQTRPGVYATANLYIPAGEGAFPAVVVMMGHSRDGKLADNYQLVGQTLAKEGYVALCIDPWGAGERTTVHGEFEYHGTALGAALLNIGETLLGMQLTDNIRAVDLLTSLPYVDKDRIGATGSSGGGNQTMWLAAIDERVKAAMPVVSVGTFDSYIMAHNCVCEVLPNGLAFTEEWGVLGLVAPRAIKMCNHHQESNPTFFPSEMQKSFVKARPVFEWHGKEAHIGYELFERPHGYFPEDREALLGWMDLHLRGKGDGSPRKEQPLELYPAQELMVFEEGKRDRLVYSTASFTRSIGEELRRKHEREEKIAVSVKRSELKSLLQISSPGSGEGRLLGKTAGWDRVLLETGDGRILPLLFKAGRKKEYAIITHSDGKQQIPLAAIRSLVQSGKGIAILDFSGTGEAYSKKSAGFDNLGHLHTYGRAALWLGETVTGNWVDELGHVARWLSKEKSAASISFHGYKSAGAAGIFYAALGGKLQEAHAYGSPVSYLFDSREGTEHFGVGIHIPGILTWGDVSLAAALVEADVIFHEPVTMSGRLLGKDEKELLQKEYDNARVKSGIKGRSLLL